jgi:hypothetical protein
MRFEVHRKRLGTAMNMSIENNTRLHLGFYDELNKVKVLTVTNDIEHRLVIMGVVNGKEKLIDLLDEAGIDHYTVGGDPGLIPPSLPTAIKVTPHKIVNTLDEGFRMVDERQLKILSGETLTEEELSISMPLSLHVFSSYTTIDEGFPRIVNWFKTQTKTVPTSWLERLVQTRSFSYEEMKEYSQNNRETRLSASAW